MLDPTARWRSLCRIEVPLRTGGVSYGTGYLVKNGLILTAAHVVEGWNESPMRIRFRGQDPDFRREFKDPDELGGMCFAATEVAWNGWDRGLDAVLLKLDKRPAGFPEGTVVSWIPRGEDRWQSAGYYRAANPENSADASAGPLCGRAYGWIPLELSVEDEPENVDVNGSWKGASGAPLFHGDQLVGVFTGWREKHHGRRLFGTPGYLLLHDRQFAELLGVHELNSEEWLQQLEAMLAELLAASGEAQQTLLFELKVTQPMQPVAMARFLLRDIDICDLALGIAEADKKLRDRGERMRVFRAKDDNTDSMESLNTAIQVLREVFRMVVPPRISAGLAKRGVGDLIRVRQEAGSGAAWVGLPVQTETLAAMLMSWVDRKPLQLTPGATGNARGDRQVGSGDFAFSKVDDFIGQLWLELCTRFNVRPPSVQAAATLAAAPSQANLPAFKANVFSYLANRARSGEAHYVVLPSPKLEADEPSKRDLEEFHAVVLRIQAAFTEPPSRDRSTPRQHLRVLVLEGDRYSFERDDLVVPANDLVARWALDDAKRKEPS